MKFEVNWAELANIIQNMPPVQFLSFAVAALAVAVVVLVWKVRK